MSKELTMWPIEDASGAEFDSKREYRYALWRKWDATKPLIMFIGLNPSTANETEPDPTITRVKDFATDWGYGGFYMMNLFALVSKEPALLKTHPNPVGDNDGWIERIAAKCKTVVFAWGDFKEARERAKIVIEQFPDALALIINKNGTPRHPLYVKGDVVPVRFRGHNLIEPITLEIGKDMQTMIDILKWANDKMLNAGGITGNNEPKMNRLPALISNNRYIGGVDFCNKSDKVCVVIYDHKEQEFVYMAEQKKDEFENILMEVTALYAEVPIMGEDGIWRRMNKDGEMEWRDSFNKAWIKGEWKK